MVLLKTTRLSGRKWPQSVCHSSFSTSGRRCEIRKLDNLPDRIQASYQESKENDLLSLKWPSPPRNILLMQKENAPKATEALLEFAQYVHASYPSISFILEAATASRLHSQLPFAIYGPEAGPSTASPQALISSKTDLTATFGGDGTILRASSFFSKSVSVPPILSFSLGTLGFLSEWKFKDYKRAFREVYMSGSESSRSGVLSHTSGSSSSSLFSSPWPESLGASHGAQRCSRILLRNRLRVSREPIDRPSSSSTVLPNPESTKQSFFPPTADRIPTHALNEILLHRGRSPHLAHITISLNGRPLTTAIADGLIISTPTGSTAYSLSASGSIVHPLVKGIVVTPVCARSLSFRPLVLPGSAVIGLRVAEGNRAYSRADSEADDADVDAGGRVDMSIDGVEVPGGLATGEEISIWGEGVGRKSKVGLQSKMEEKESAMGEGMEDQVWMGGVPCVMRGGRGEEGADEGWVGGLNGLLKFNSPFGEEVLQ